MDKRRVGFIGMGAMGAPMAGNVLKAGYPLGVYNRTAARAEPLKEKGAAVYDTPRALAENSDIVVIMVTGPPALDHVLSGPEGLIAGLREGTAVINMSTVSHESTFAAVEAVSSAGGVFIDAPVSGSVKPAEDGTLVILAGGRPDAIEKVTPLLLAIGKEVVYCGGHGAGTCMKMMINLMLGGMMTLFAEALALGRKMGLETQDMLGAIALGAMNAPLFQAKGRAVIKRNFTKQFPVSLLFKDLNLIMDAAGRVGVPLPVGAAAREAYSAAMAQGYSGEDMAAVIKVVEAASGERNY